MNVLKNHTLHYWYSETGDINSLLYKPRYAFVFDNNMSTTNVAVDAYITVIFEFRGEHRFYDPA